MALLEAIAGGAVSALVEMVLKKAGSSTLELMGVSSELTSSIQKLEQMLRNVSEVLEITQKYSWMTSLQDAVFEAEGVLDELEYERLKRQVTSFNPPFICVKYSFLHRIRKIQNKLDSSLKTASRISRVSETPKSIPDLTNISHNRETTSIVNSKQFLGRKSQEEKIIGWLLNPNHGRQVKKGEDMSVSDNSADPYLPVLSIYGMGGIGKTTLAQHIFNNDRVTSHFDDKVWVHVSEQFDEKKIIVNILESLSIRKSDKDEVRDKSQDITDLLSNSLRAIMSENATMRRDYRSLEALQIQLNNILKEMVLLLVLDDVWNDDQDELDRLQLYFQYGKQGSKILVTTRTKKIAAYMAGPKIEPIKLDGLGEKDFWCLFKKHAFGDEFSSTKNLKDLETIGKQIAEKLKGSPLAAKTIGRILNNKLEIAHWTKISRSELWDIEQKESDIMPALWLSYQHLPSYLKPCFTYLLLIPKGWWISKTELIHLWIAQGFVQTRDTEGNPISVGREYIDDLLNYCLIQERKHIHGDLIQYNHDLIYDAARMIPKHHIFVITNDRYKTVPKDVRHLSIQADASQIDWKKIASHLDIKRLHSVFIGGNHWFETMHSDSKDFALFLRTILAKGNNIKVLVLENLRVTRIPYSIVNLKRLRHLCLLGSAITALPKSFECLYQLRYLDLRHCNKLGKLPKQMERLVNLSHFDGEHKLLGIPCFEQLKSTKKLSFEVSHSRRPPIKHLGGLNDVELLTVKGLENINSKEEAMEANLKQKTHLQFLQLIWSPQLSLPNHTCMPEQVLEGLQPSSHIRCLRIENYRGIRCPEWVVGHHLSNLQSICLHKCSMLEELPTLRTFQDSIQHVSLQHCEQLPGTPLLVDDDLIPTRLSVLSIINCGEFGNSLQLKHIVRLKYLTKLYLEGCANIEYVPTKTLQSQVHLDVSKCTTESIEERTVGFQALTSLVTLAISKCPNLLNALDAVALPPTIKVLNLGEFPQESLFSIPLDRLELFNSENLQLLPTQVLRSVNRLTIEGCPNLYPPKASSGQLESMDGSNLKRFQIANTSLINLKEWLLVLKLSKLETLKIENIQELESFAINELDGFLADMPSLSYFYLKNLYNLQSLPITLQKHPIPCLLKINKCPKIRTLPANILAEVLEIIDCPELLRRLPKKDIVEIEPSRYLVKHPMRNSKFHLLPCM